MSDTIAGLAAGGPTFIMFACLSVRQPSCYAKVYLRHQLFSPLLCFAILDAALLISTILHKRKPGSQSSAWAPQH